MAKVKYFISSISSAGYISFFDKNYISSGKIVPLHFCDYDKVSQVAKHFSGLFSRKGYDCNIILSPVDLRIAGLWISQVQTGFMNFYPHEKTFYGTPTSPALKSSVDNINTAYAHLKDAKEIHDKWEKLYISAMDFKAINNLRDKLLDEIFSGVKPSKKKKTIAKDRFFGATSFKGAKDCVKDLIKPIKRRYFIKGRPGTGKSTFMKSFVDKALELGLDTEVYHCAFDPSSIDMLIIRELELCIFDSTSPHEYQIDSKDDIILDFYELGFERDFEQKNEKALSEIKKQYSSTVALAVRKVRLAKTLYDSYTKEKKSLQELYKETKELDIARAVLSADLS